MLLFFFFFNDTATTEIYTLSLHDALPIWRLAPRHRHVRHPATEAVRAARAGWLRTSWAGRRRSLLASRAQGGDRKSTRLNSSHSQISYAVFCLKKKKKKTTMCPS